MPKVLGLVTGLFCVVAVVQACGSDDGKRVTRQDAAGGEAGAPLGGNGAGGDAGAGGDPAAGGNAQGGVANEPVGGEATGGVAQGGATETPVVAPSFSTQPTNQSVVEPATVTFTVVVGGSPVLELQWQVSTDGGSDWVDIAGATSASYTTAATALADSGRQYRVIATNGAGAVVSAAATLTVTLASVPKSNTLAAGNQHTCAIRANGSLACWGYNSSGQVGNGNRIAAALPTTVALPEATIGVAAGYDSSCALGSSGTLRCWGDAFASLTPVVVGGVNGVDVGGGIKEITVGRGHACVLTVAGNVWCRGSNSAGQLGNGTTAGSDSLVQVEGAGGLALTNVTGLSAIDFHTCASRTNGSVMCWGQDAPTPSLIAIEVGDMTDATQVSGDCAVVSGNVLCWSGIAAANPLPVAGLSNITRIGFGGPNCAIVSGGTVQCWGSGVMGNGQLFEIDVPPVVVSQQDAVGAIATGGGHTCLLRTDAALRCWGSGQFGQLGVGDTTGRTTPTNVPDAVGWAAP